MKKILFYLTLLITLGISTMNVYAIEEEQITTNVYAKVKMFDKPNIHKGKKKKNKHIFKINKKTDVIINYGKNDKNDLFLYQISKEDKEYSWLESCIKKYATSYVPYNFFSIDEEGNIEGLPNKTDISIKDDKINKKTKIMGVASDSTTCEIETYNRGKYINFETDEKYSYYVLCEENEPSNIKENVIKCVNALIMVCMGIIGVIMYKKNIKKLRGSMLEDV